MRECSFSSELAPCLDFDVVEALRAEGVDEGGGKTGVGDEGNVEIDGCTANLVAVGEFTHREVLGHVDYHVDVVAVEQVERLWLLSFLAGPMDEGVGDAVFCQIARCTACGIELIAMFNELLGRTEHVGFLLAWTC